MFTGIIEQQAKIIKNSSNKDSNNLLVSVDAQRFQLGESIAINGVCLTVMFEQPGQLGFDVSAETLERSTLGSLTAGTEVNFERAMQANNRFGGHYVSGHVDTTAFIKEKTNKNGFCEMSLAGFSIEQRLYLLEKGSITVDGISLTINAVSGDSVLLMLVPHTLAMTNLGRLALGAKVNIEFDYLTRIVAHQLQMLGQSTGVS